MHAMPGRWPHSRCVRGSAWPRLRTVLGQPPSRWQRLVRALHRPADWHSALIVMPVSWSACPPVVRLNSASGGPWVRAQAPRCTAHFRRAACRAAQGFAALRGLPLCQREPASQQ